MRNLGIFEYFKYWVLSTRKKGTEVFLDFKTYFKVNKLLFKHVKYLKIVTIFCKFSLKSSQF